MVRYAFSAALAAAVMAGAGLAQAQGVVLPQVPPSSPNKPLSPSDILRQAAEAAAAEAIRSVTPPAPTAPAATTPAATKPAPATTIPGVQATLNRDERIAVQKRLTQLGYDTRGVDGAFGSGTRRAINSWQAAQGHTATGALTRAEFNALLAGVSVTPANPAQPAATNAAADAALGTTRADRIAVQQRLTQLGYDTRGADGVFGSGTRRAISAWQAAQGHPATGALTKAQFDALRGAATAAPATPTLPAATGATAEAALGLTREDRMLVQRRLIQLGYNTRGADGVFGSGTRRAITAWQTAQGVAATGYLDDRQLRTLRGTTVGTTPAPTAPAAPTTPAPAAPGAASAGTAQTEAALSLDSAGRAEVQTRLSALGYNTRGIDGAFGSGTRRAITAWQGDNGLPVTGYLNARQLEVLRGQRRN